MINMMMDAGPKYFKWLQLIHCVFFICVHAYGPHSVLFQQHITPHSNKQTSQLNTNKIQKFGGMRSFKSSHRIKSSANPENGDAASESVDSALSQVLGELNRMKLWDEIAALEDKASQSEDPGERTRLNKKIQAKKLEDPYIALLSEEDLAVREQRLEDAVRIQLEMEKVGLPPPWREANKAQSVGSNRSVSESDGIRVEAASFYSPEQSNPSNGMYLFLYHIKITNTGDQVVQLISREWQIEPATGNTETVKGPGVVGQQPVLLPGQSFEYTSACPLRSSLITQLQNNFVGQMSGKYFFAAGDVGQQRFGLFIKPFNFVLPKQY